MNDYLNIATRAALVAALTALGMWAARIHPCKAGRTVIALMTACFASYGSMDFGCRFSDIRGPWSVHPGYSCGETKILAFILLYGAVVLIRAAWRSIAVDEKPAARAAVLIVACLGLALIGFTFSESEKAHDRFHQVQHQSETHR